MNGRCERQGWGAKGWVLVPVCERQEGRAEVLGDVALPVCGSLVGTQVGTQVAPSVSAALGMEG